MYGAAKIGCMIAQSYGDCIHREFNALGDDLRQHV
jgi:hypothetical protein